MSSSQHAVPLRAVGDARIAVLVALPLFSALVAAVLAADTPHSVTRLSPSEAQSSGRAISLVPHAVGDATLVELQSPDAGVALLGVSADGRMAAVADRIGELTGTLTVAMDDGAQLQVPFPGLLAATFGPDGSWLAVVDGRGAVWKLDAASGGRELLHDGPFVGTPVIAEDGSLLLLAVPSVEAPYRSRLVRLAMGTGIAEPISEEELVYAVFPLDGADLAVVAHEATGTEVWRLSGATERRLAVLGPGAVNVTVSRTGSIAFERRDDGIFLLDAAGSTPRGIGSGSRPCFDPGGTALLVDRDGQRVALAMDGSVAAAVGDIAAFAGSEGCVP